MIENVLTRMRDWYEEMLPGLRELTGATGALVAWVRDAA